MFSRFGLFGSVLIDSYLIGVFHFVFCFRMRSVPIKTRRVPSAQSSKLYQKTGHSGTETTRQIQLRHSLVSRRSTAVCVEYPWCGLRSLRKATHSCWHVDWSLRRQARQM